MQLLAADVRGSEKVSLDLAWAGYSQVLSGRFLKGGRQIEQAAAEASGSAGTTLVHASCLGLAGLAARVSCDWEAAERSLPSAARGFAAAKDARRSGLMLALHLEALAARGLLERAQTDLKTMVGEHGAAVDADIAALPLRIAQGRWEDAHQIAGAALSRYGQDADSELHWWLRSFEVEAFCDQRRYEEATDTLESLLSKWTASAASGEVYVRILCQLAQARLGAAWQDASRRTPPWQAEIGATLKKVRLISAAYPRYQARYQALQASAESLLGEPPHASLHQSKEALEKLSLTFESSRLAEEYATVSAGPLQDLIEDAQTSFVLHGAQARADALAAPSTTEGPRPTLMLSRTQLTAQVAPGQDLELDGVFAVNRAISAVLSVPELMERILAEVSRVLKAERAAIIHRDAAGTVVCVASHNLDPRMVRPQSQEISFTVVESALDDHKTVLTDNAQSDERFRGQASVMATEIRSVLCAPLQTKKRNYGCIYLDSTLRTGLFKPLHRELIKVFATQAATALENAEAFEALDSLNATLEERVVERTEQLQETNTELERVLTEVREIQLRLVQAEKDALEKEMAVARDIQQTLVPSTEVFAHGKARVAGVVQPASFVGGDIWIYKPIDEQRFLVIVGDATGHGVGPGMVTAAMKASVDALVRPKQDVHLESLFYAMHDAVFQAAAGKIRVSAFGCVVDIREGIQECISASHPPPLLVTDPTGLAQMRALGGTRSTGIGVDGEPSFEAFRPDVPAGSRLVLLTDGILEGENEKGRPFGVRRFGKAAVLGARLPVDGHRDAILAAGEEFRGSVPLDDDVTVVVVQLP